MKLMIAALAVLLAGCAGGGAAGPLPGMPAAQGDAPAPAIAPPRGSCHVRPGPLPDPSCTPGALNPDVAQSTIASTICRKGWTKTVRPQLSFTEPLKRDLMASYGQNGAMHAYELDHLVSLELGGAPASVRNLWPEPNDHPRPAVANSKDLLESALNQQVCSGRMTLSEAQRCIATDWVACQRRVPPAPSIPHPAE